MTESKKIHHESEDKITEVDFSGLILGFSSAALYYIGVAELEGKKVSHKNLPLAKQNIGIIEMLHEKTKGNLSPEESVLLNQLLKDLNSKYKEAQKHTPK